MKKKDFRTSLTESVFLILFVATSSHATNFTYSSDPLNRLTNSAYSDGSHESYSYDSAGNRLSRVTTAATTNLDATSPTISTNITAPFVGTNKIALFWNRGFDTGGSGLAGYQIFLNGVLIGSTTTTNYLLSNLLDATTYCVSVAAYDRATNISTHTPDVCFTTLPDNSANGAQLSAIKVGTNGAISFNLDGTANKNFVIQVSSNLVDWLPYAKGTMPPVGTTLITDTNLYSQSRQFYRVVQGTFVDNFIDAPIYTNNWYVAQNIGANYVTCTPGNMRVEVAGVPYPVSIWTLLSTDSYVGDIDYSVQLKRQGKGITSVGLWSNASNNWLMSSELYAVSENYLIFNGDASAHPGDSYLNHWITLRIKTIGNMAYFFADGVLMESNTFTPSGSFRLALSLSNYITGLNDTSFRLVTATGTKQ